LHLVGYLYYWQMGFNSVFKGLKFISVKRLHEWSYTSTPSQAMPSWHTLE